VPNFYGTPLTFDTCFAQSAAWDFGASVLAGALQTHHSVQQSLTR